MVRHEHTPNFPGEWKNANVELIRVDGPPSPTGKCNDTHDGPVPFSMAPEQLYTAIVPPFCLEEGQRYQIKFTFDQHDGAKSDPKANILIDSVWSYNRYIIEAA